MKRSAQTNGAASRKSAKTASGQTAGQQSRVQRSNAPLATSSSTRSSKVQEVRLPNGNRQLTFCEYVQDLAGSVGFAVSKFPVQPGLPTLFAWLSGQAQYYNEYQFKRLGFRFETEKAATLSGKVMFAFNPDAADAAPGSKQEMLEFEDKAADVLWKAFRLDVPVRRRALGEELYVRAGALAANLDIKDYDLGNLWVATQGMADTSAVGELYVEYTIELISPIVSLSALATATSATIVGNGAADGSHFGTSPTITGGLDVTATVNTMTFNRVGTYLLAGADTGTGMNTSYVPAFSGTASTANLNGSGYGISNNAGNAGTVANWAALVTVTARGQTAVIDTSSQTVTLIGSTVVVAAFGP